jgi:hypothetical protein
MAKQPLESKSLPEFAAAPFATPPTDERAGGNLAQQKSNHSEETSAPSVAITAPATIQQLEQRFLTSRKIVERIELAEEIAGFDNAQSVNSMARLFHSETHPQVKVAMIAKLADIDSEAAPDVRLSMLAAALDRQPRDVRTTALEVLEALDDGRAEALLQKSSRTDPDREVRDLAKTFLKSRSAAR